MPKLMPREEDRINKAFASLVGSKVYGNKDFSFEKIAKPYIGCHPSSLWRWTKDICIAPTGKMVKIAKALGLSREDVMNALWP
jgi:hypothetical protein